MEDVISRKTRVANEGEACRHCEGIGAVRPLTDSAEVVPCPRCGGRGLEPPPLGDCILWPQGETARHGADGRDRGRPDARLQCRYVRRNAAGVVRASGDIDLHNVHRLAEMLEQALGDTRTIIVDLGGVSYIDSTGLNLLMRLHEHCAQRETKMAVVFTSANLQRIFSILRLHEVLRIFPTVGAALAALSPGERGDSAPEAEQPAPGAER